MKAPILLALLLSGCLTMPHTVEHVQVGGRLVAVHTDHPSDPCSETAAACYDFSQDAVFLRSPVRPDTREHELAHAGGMLHTPWFRDALQRPCAKVLLEDAGGRYKIGNTICLDARGEFVY